MSDDENETRCGLHGTLRCPAVGCGQVLVKRTRDLECSEDSPACVQCEHCEATVTVRQSVRVTFHARVTGRGGA